MGLRFRKTFKVAPGVKFTLGKKSTGLSIGGKYGGMTFNSRSGARVRASAPGTGLSYSTKVGGSKGGSRSTGSSSSGSVQTVEVNALAYLLLTLLLGWAGVHRFYRKQIGLGLIYLFTGGIGGIGWLIDSIIAIVKFCQQSK